MRAVFTVVGVATLAWLGWSCAASRPAERAERVRCGTIELFPPALSPTRPYRVIGPVTTDDRLGDQSLRDEACRAGGDAVIDFRRESGLSSASNLGSGSAIDARVTLSGTAIVYTDHGDGGTAPPP